MSVTLQLTDEIDLSRGDMLVAAKNPPHVARTFRAMVVWLHARPLEMGETYLVKHTARQTKIRATRIRHRVNVNTLARESAARLQMNEIAEVEFEANVPLFFDAYSRNRTTGSFILIDPLSNATIGAGMIEGSAGEDSAAKVTAREFAMADAAAVGPKLVAARERYARHGHYPGLILLESRPELAARLERALFEQGFEAVQVSVGEIASDALADAARLALAAGVVVIYSGDSLAQETTDRIGTATKARVFRVAATGGGDDTETLRSALAFAHSLRLASETIDREKVN
jgi:hypothetical protein